MYNLKNQIMKILFIKEKFANPRKFQPSKYTGYMVVISRVHNRFMNSWLYVEQKIYKLGNNW